MKDEKERTIGRSRKCRRVGEKATADALLEERHE